VRELLDPTPDALSTFLIRWFGPPARDALRIPGAERLPAPLREWYATASRWPRHIVGIRMPGDVKRHADKLVFLDKEESEFYWAADAGVEDPAVYDISPDEGEQEWRPVESSLRRFLLWHTAYETAAFRADLRKESLNATEAQVAQVTAAMTPVPHGPWRWPAPGAQLFAAEDALAFVCRAEYRDPDQCCLQYAALSEPALEAFDFMRGWEWQVTRTSA
jgi:hypothetical protein